jgi:hypothetical protein
MTISLLSCKKQVDNLAIVFEHKHNVSLSNIISDVKFIKLETSDSCQIGYIYQIIIHNDKIFVLDFPTGKSVVVFDMNGKYLNKIDRFGSGPGEFIFPHYISMDKVKNILYIIDSELKKLLLFDSNTLEFIREERTGVDAHYFSLLNNSNAYIWSNTLDIFAGETYPFHFMVTDKKYNVLHTAVPMEIKTGYVLRWGSPFTFYKNSTCFTHPYKNRVYEVTEDTCLLKHTMYFEGYKFPSTEFLQDNVESEDFMKRFMVSGYIRYFTYFETNDHIVCNLFNEHIHMGIYNKNNQNGCCFELEHITNDIRIGCFAQPLICENNTFYSIIQASELVKSKENGLISNAILDKIGAIDEEDNPVILKYKIIY